LGFVIAEDGRREEAERAFEASLAADREALAIDDSIPYRWIDMASIHAYRGDRARALEALQKAVDRGFLFDFALRTDPMFATLQTDTGFRQILERIASRKRELQADAERSGALAPYDRLITAGPVGGTASR
jgi:tetratricopeptide (TPR) repeat protein